MTFVAQSERLGLQPMTVEAHLQPYHASNTDSRISRWTNRTPFVSLAESEAQLRARLPSEQEPWRESYAVMLLSEPPIYVGSIGVPRMSEDGDATEVGYSIHPDHWGHGYATEALKLFIYHYWNGKRPIQKDLLIAFTDTENEPSERVLTKGGFQRGVINKDYEIVHPVTGVKFKRDFTTWRYERPAVPDQPSTHVDEAPTCAFD